MKTTSILSSVLTLLCFSLTGYCADPPATMDSDKVQWMKLASPGDNHKALNDIVGKWKFTSKFWMTPDGKPEESKGTSTSKWVMGGRFVAEEIKSNMNGQKFEGIGYTGFDNIRQEYQSVWLDNMATGIMFSNGTMENKALKAAGTVSCPMTGEKDKWFRSELKILSKNEHVFEMYGKTADGKEYKNMEITSKRVN